MLQQFLTWTTLSMQLSGLPVDAPADWYTGGFTIEEIAVGAGKTLEEGDLVTVQFVASTREGKELASTEKRGLPYRFIYGEADPGYLQLATFGMAVGGVRTVVLPPELAFGDKGIPPVVGPKTTLVLRVKVLRAEKPEGKE